MNRSKIGMVFPFKKQVDGIPMRVIKSLKESQRFDFDTMRPWFTEKNHHKDHYTEGFNVELDPKVCSPQSFSIRSILGREMVFPMKSIPVMIAPAISITTEGIGGFFGDVKVLTSLNPDERAHRSKVFNTRNKYSKSFMVYLINKYGRSPLRSVLFPFRNFYTMSNDGHLCLNGDDIILMQNAYEATKKELKELFERNHRGLGAKSKDEFEKFLVIDTTKEANILNAVQGYMFGWFLSTWQRYAAKEVLRLIQNFNMGYATDENLHPDMPSAQDLMKFYNERIKEKDTKSKRVYWTTKIQNSSDANDAERRGWQIPGETPAQRTIIDQWAVAEWMRAATLNVRRPTQFNVVQERNEAQNTPEVVVIQPQLEVAQNQQEVHNEPNDDGRIGAVGEGSGEDVREADH